MTNLDLINKKAFSLAEAMVVLVIISILVSSFSGAFGSYYIGEVLINKCIAGNMEDQLLSVVFILGSVYLAGIIATLIYNRVKCTDSTAKLSGLNLGYLNLSDSVSLPIQWG